VSSDTKTILSCGRLRQCSRATLLPCQLAAWLQEQGAATGELMAGRNRYRSPKEPAKIVPPDSNFATPNFATLTRDVSVPVWYGVVSIRTGTKVRIVSRTNSTLRIRNETQDQLPRPRARVAAS
jgi:hypothetical protein